MPNLTSKELTALEDQLGLEQVLVRKYQYIADQCTEMPLKNSLKCIAGKHQQHYNTLLSYLQQ